MNTPNPLALKLQDKFGQFTAGMSFFYVLHKLNGNDNRCVLFDDTFPCTNAVSYAQCRFFFTTWPLGRHVIAD
jgi:hypothetical protein